MTTTPAPLVTRLTAELAGTAVLTAVVVGSGFKAAALGTDGAVGLLAGVGAPALALAVLIALLGPVSGGHFNPLVSAAAWWTGDRSRAGLRALGGYAAAQTAGAVAGTVLAAAMYGRPLVELSTRHRDGGALRLGEVVATGTLLLVIGGLVRGGRGRLVPAAVGLWTVAACWATSSGGFANPALTLARTLTGGDAGIAPGSVPGFVLAQCAGAVAGTALAALLFGGGDDGRPAGARALAPEGSGAGVAAEGDRGAARAS
ncbi:aquaporin [Kitasatospora sp. NPDC004240]